MFCFSYQIKQDSQKKYKNCFNYSEILTPVSAKMKRHNPTKKCTNLVYLFSYQPTKETSAEILYFFDPWYLSNKKNKTDMQPIEYIINSNMALFGLRFENYIDGKPVYSEPSEKAIKEATKDLELFTERQEAIYKRTKITNGDWIELKDGTFSRVTVLYEEQVQIGGSEHGSYHIGKSGVCSYSGSCGDIVEKKFLKKTTRYKDGSCWIFSQDWTGAHRGVYNILKFKVWKEI